jgi:hypothetical protein
MKSGDQDNTFVIAVLIFSIALAAALIEMMWP